MKTWIVRFVSLYLFNLIVLWIIGLVIGSVRIGWAAFWASILLTIGTLWIRPAIMKAFRSAAAKSASQRTKVGEKVVQYLLALAVAAIVWVIIVIFSGVRVNGFFWGWVLPPIILTITWAIYGAIAAKLEAKGGEMYDRALGGRPASDANAAIATEGPAASAPTSPAAETGRREMQDGLTDEQRRMFDNL